MPISKFISMILMLAGLVACVEDRAETENATKEQTALDGKVECALAGSASFERTCTTERVAGETGQVLIIRHADGGFRRFNILTDGRGLAPADGFDATLITLIENGMIEVSSGDDKYRLPAQIKSADSRTREYAG